MANGEMDDDVGADVMVDPGSVVMVDMKVTMVQLPLMKENT